jgi:hypothetical protein
MKEEELKEEAFSNNMAKVLGSLDNIMLSRFGKEKADELLTQIIFVIADEVATEPLLDSGRVKK